MDKSTFQFLDELKKNNNREWFTANKSTFKSLEKKNKLFFEKIYNDLNTFDKVDAIKMFRIYRDVRFSKDKTPYKTHFSCAFHREKPKLRGGYYLHLEPNNSFLATGFWDLEKKDLKRIRDEFVFDATQFRKVVDTPSFKKVWGDLVGDELKTAPKGYDKMHSNIDLIKKKQYLFVKKLKTSEVYLKDFESLICHSFKAVLPYFDFMSEVLTTNQNGESII